MSPPDPQLPSIQSLDGRSHTGREPHPRRAGSVSTSPARKSRALSRRRPEDRDRALGPRNRPGFETGELANPYAALLPPVSSEHARTTRNSTTRRRRSEVRRRDRKGLRRHRHEEGAVGRRKRETITDPRTGPRSRSAGARRKRVRRRLPGGPDQPPPRPPRRHRREKLRMGRAPAHRLELQVHVVRASPASLAVLREAQSDQRLHRGGGFRPDGENRRRIVRQDGRERRRHTGALERAPPVVIS